MNGKLPSTRVKLPTSKHWIEGRYHGVNRTEVLLFDHQF